MGQTDQEYLLARAEQERELASRSADELVRAIHLKLAHEYAMRAHGNDLLSRRDDDVLGGTASRLTML
ncbi:hypothetical protein [Sphingomonas sp. LHG3443-2]|uniref:hypothetical protein n=1 Tax=Sphingomonas sp. LHG3443-2 TaxID=2804639 RepID=UPI003CF36370